MTVKLKKNPNCKICSDQAEIHELIDYEDFCGSSANNHAIPAASKQDMTPQQLAARLQAGEAIQLVDVREAVEQQISILPGAQLIPLGELASRLNELNPTQPVVLFCRTGVRSQRGLSVLAAAGFEQLYNLRGGINAWAQEVDHSMLQY
jgi:sulfur-carrier protein adenylyltransferase/sulfurtransferase